MPADERSVRAYRRRQKPGEELVTVRIREIMSKPAVVVPPELPVKEAIATLDATGFTGLPVPARPERADLRPRPGCSRGDRR
jgi:predicted transcriptional regulator